MKKLILAFLALVSLIGTAKGQYVVLGTQMPAIPGAMRLSAGVVEYYYSGNWLTLASGTSLWSQSGSDLIFPNSINYLRNSTDSIPTMAQVRVLVGANSGPWTTVPTGISYPSSVFIGGNITANAAPTVMGSENVNGPRSFSGPVNFTGQLSIQTPIGSRLNLGSNVHLSGPIYLDNSPFVYGNPTFSGSLTFLQANYHLGREVFIDSAIFNGGTNLSSNGSGTVYQPGTLTWYQTGFNMPSAGGSAFTASGLTILANDTVFVIGGYNGSINSNMVAALDLNTMEWVSKPTFSSFGESGNAAGAINDTVYMLCGSGGGGGLRSDTVFTFNPFSQTWSIATTTAPAVWAPAYATWHNRIYIIGGYGNSAAVTTVGYFTPPSTFTTGMTSLPSQTQTYNNTAATIGDTIYVTAFGSNAIEAYDVNGNSWSAKAAAPGTIIAGSRAISCNGSLYVFLAAASTVYVYNPSTNSWSTATWTGPVADSNGMNLVARQGEIYVLSSLSGYTMYKLRISY